MPMSKKHGDISDQRHLLKALLGCSGIGDDRVTAILARAPENEVTGLALNLCSLGGEDIEEGVYTRRQCENIIINFLDRMELTYNEENGHDASNLDKMKDAHRYESSRGDAAYSFRRTRKNGMEKARLPDPNREYISLGHMLRMMPTATTQANYDKLCDIVSRQMEQEVDVPLSSQQTIPAEIAFGYASTRELGSGRQVLFAEKGTLDYLTREMGLPVPPLGHSDEDIDRMLIAIRTEDRRGKEKAKLPDETRNYISIGAMLDLMHITPTRANYKKLGALMIEDMANPASAVALTDGTSIPGNIAFGFSSTRDNGSGRQILYADKDSLNYLINKMGLQPTLPNDRDHWISVTDVCNKLGHSRTKEGYRRVYQFLLATMAGEHEIKINDKVIPAHEVIGLYRHNVNFMAGSPTYPNTLYVDYSRIESFLKEHLTRLMVSLKEALAIMQTHTPREKVEAAIEGLIEKDEPILLSDGVSLKPELIFKKSASEDTKYTHSYNMDAAFVPVLMEILGLFPMPDTKKHANWEPAYKLNNRVGRSHEPADNKEIHDLLKAALLDGKPIDIGEKEPVAPSEVIGLFRKQRGHNTKFSQESYTLLASPRIEPYLRENLICGRSEKQHNWQSPAQLIKHFHLRENKENNNAIRNLMQDIYCSRGDEKIDINITGKPETPTCLIKDVIKPFRVRGGKSTDGTQATWYIHPQATDMLLTKQAIIDRRDSEAPSSWQGTTKERKAAGNPGIILTANLAG